jgi:hypothetical protein
MEIDLHLTQAIHSLDNFGFVCLFGFLQLIVLAQHRKREVV